MTRKEKPVNLATKSNRPVIRKKDEQKAIIEEDERHWQAAFDATTPEQLAALEKIFIEDEERGGTTPLDFTDK